MDDHASSALNFGDAVVALGRSSEFPAQVKLVSSPLLAALGQAGTAHVYADTASDDELAELVQAGPGSVLAEIDGNTANQPLVRKVLEAVLDAGDPAAWAAALRRYRPELSPEQALPLLYAIACGRIGKQIVRRFAGQRRWEVSLQLHMGLCGDPGRAVEIGGWLRQIVPSALVKVPFTPQAPHCFLVARDLERKGIPVNFTSTFSARQVVAAALLGGVARTNVFLGRLDQGLEAERLGDHVLLEAQRALLRLRREQRVETLLIAASIHRWRTLVETAGCDVYTAPCGVLAELLRQQEVEPGEIGSQLDVSFADRLGVSGAVESQLGAERIGRLWRVEPEFVGFLAHYRGSREFRQLRDGAALARRFDAEGFGDFFHAPDEMEWKEIRRGKIPEMGGELARRLALDTLFSLHADADFEQHQEAMDGEMLRRIGRG